MVYSQRTVIETTVYLIKDLEPHKQYTVSVKVISDSMTSEAVMENVVTMIDREYTIGFSNHCLTTNEFLCEIDMLFMFCQVHRCP